MPPTNINYLTRSMSHPTTLRGHGVGSVKLNAATTRKPLPVVYLNTAATSLDERIVRANARFKYLMRSGDKTAALAVSRECSTLEREKLRAIGVR